VTESVPIIDLTPWFAGTEDGKAAIARQVAEACESIGFLVISGHRVPHDLIDRAFAAVSAFYSLPQVERDRWRPTVSSSARGYHAIETKNLAKTLGYDNPPDLREQFYLGPVTDRSESYSHLPDAAPLYAANVWPDQPAEYRPVMTAYYEALQDLGGTLMRIFARALDMDENYFDDKTNRHFSTLPANHYPPPAGDPKPGQVRCGEHTDFGSLTILALNDAPGGLQVKWRDGTWRDVTASPGQFIVNIGDMMQRWTNDRWLSNLHRVVNPPADQRAGSRRLSIGYFLHPNYDAEITCLPGCEGPDNPARYPPARAGDLMHRKLQARAA
jgi:isopenicillin N synthase-like dioxygenase